MSLSFSINFITSHDGFTLKDLVTFNRKHNFANREQNRDGDNHNNSWNHGTEGPTTNLLIKDLRKRQQKNLILSLLISKGVPMILMGDEIGRSQGGNNNSWCQNNLLGWMNWEHDQQDLELLEYFKIDAQNVIVFHDDLDVNFGKIKAKFGGSSAGHNGIDSIDKNIGKNYSRIRIGIGRPKNNSTGSDHVLDNFSNDEKGNIEEVTKNIIESLSILIKKDLDLFSSKVNQK